MAIGSTSQSFFTLVAGSELTIFYDSWPSVKNCKWGNVDIWHLPGKRSLSASLEPAIWARAFGSQRADWGTEGLGKVCMGGNGEWGARTLLAGSPNFSSPTTVTTVIHTDASITWCGVVGSGHTVPCNESILHTSINVKGFEALY